VPYTPHRRICLELSGQPVQLPVSAAGGCHIGPRGGPAERQMALSTMERDELIVTLRRLGRTQTQIARRLGMTQQGVAKALSRIAEGRPGRDPRA